MLLKHCIVALKWEPGILYCLVTPLMVFRSLPNQNFSSKKVVHLVESENYKVCIILSSSVGQCFLRNPADGSRRVPHGTTAEAVLLYLNHS